MWKLHAIQNNFLMKEKQSRYCNSQYFYSVLYEEKDKRRNQKDLILFLE